MKTVNPSPLQKLKDIGEAVTRRLTLVFGAAAASIMLFLFFFGGVFYAILAGFAAAAGVVHMFGGPTWLAILLGAFLAFMAMQPGIHLLLFIAAFLGATYAWEWNSLLAFIVFLPGLFFIPLAFFAAAILGFRNYNRIRRG